MDSFNRDMSLLISDYIFQYNQTILAEFSSEILINTGKTPAVILSDILQRHSQSFYNKNVIEPEVPLIKEHNTIVDNTDIKTPSSNPDEELCAHILLSGKNKGKNCSNKLVKGKQYCRSHLPSGCMFTLTTGIKVGQCCGKLISDKSISGKYCKVHISKEISDKHFLIFKNKYGNYEHAFTELLFKDSMIYGKQGKDGVVSPLTDDDYECVKQYKFKLIPELMVKMKDYLERSK